MMIIGRSADRRRRSGGVDHGVDVGGRLDFRSARIVRGNAHLSGARRVGDDRRTTKRCKVAWDLKKGEGGGGGGDARPNKAKRC